MRTWPALDVGGRGVVGAGYSRPDDELIQAALADHDIAAIEELPGSWRVYFQTQLARDQASAALSLEFPNLTISPIDVPDEDWAARSQASLKAVTVGNLVIAPPWDVPGRLKPAPTTDNTRVDIGAASYVGAAAYVGAAFRRPVTIVIQPSMGFGTGHHATTRLCLAALQALDLRGRRLLDVGTGSGVLAIAASLLGATDVAGIDSDPDAVQAARENVGLNPGASVSLDVTDLTSVAAGRFDVVLANLTGGLLIQAARRLHDVTAADGVLVLSGFMRSEEEAVRAAYSDLAIRARGEEDEWVCVTLSPGTA